jgi:alkylation response protein AidB-like acyl-CoA dehydrogenase
VFRVLRCVNVPAALNQQLGQRPPGNVTSYTAARPLDSEGGAVRRDLFTEDHEAFRAVVREFVAKEVVPNYPDWESVGRMPRAVFKRLGSLGLLGMAIPEEYGGALSP